MRSRAAPGSALGEEQKPASVVKQKQERMAPKRTSLSHGDLYQQQRLNYHDNDSNKASNNNYKVRLLVAPAGGVTPAGTKQQETIPAAAGIVHSSADWQPPRSQYSSARAKINHHHYDCATESDLTSSQLANSNNYEQNILLFATEHQAADSRSRSRSRSQDQSQRAAYVCPQPLQAADLMRLAGQKHQQPLHGLAQPRTGKFVSHYPSWRHTNSPTFQHQNYSFHVPLSPQQLHPAAREQRQLYRLRHGSVRSARFKSRTIAHLPQYGAQRTAPTGADEQERAQQSAADADLALATKQYVLSEGDLLMAQRVPVNRDLDNPFRPGTELSWEADMMVRLMKRGYPVQELPALVEAAKQVARKAAADQPEPARAQTEALARRQSVSSELDMGGKQLWASSLSRAKSAPRFADADSIDQLITSIEHEMGELLQEQAAAIVERPAGECVAGRRSSGGDRPVVVGSPLKMSPVSQEGPRRASDRQAAANRRKQPATSSQKGGASEGTRKRADLMEHKERGSKCCAIQ